MQKVCPLENVSPIEVVIPAGLQTTPDLLRLVMNGDICIVLALARCCRHCHIRGTYVLKSQQGLQSNRSKAIEPQDVVASQLSQAGSAGPARYTLEQSPVSRQFGPVPSCTICTVHCA